MSVKHVLFDNDGTIVDTEILAVEAELALLARHGVHISLRDYCMRFPGMTTRNIMETLQAEYGFVLEADYLERQRLVHEKLFDERLEVIPGMDRVFKAVQKPKSMVSNAQAHHVERCLKRVNLHEHLTGQIFSAGQVDKPKPHPDVYLLALQTWGLHPSEAIAVEDSPVGVAAAKAAGLFVFGFLGAAHIQDGHETLLLKAGADAVAADAEALLHYFSNLGLL